MKEFLRYRAIYHNLITVITILSWIKHFRKNKINIIFFATFYFQAITSMHSELIAVDRKGRLRQWKWSSNSPYEKDGIFHPRTADLGLTDKSVLNLLFIKSWNRFFSFCISSTINTSKLNCRGTLTVKDKLTSENSLYKLKDKRVEVFIKLLVYCCLFILLG